MKTEQIIETLQNYKNGILDENLSKSDINAGIAIDAAIEKIQELEQKSSEMGLDFIKHIVKLEREQNHWKEEAARCQEQEKYFKILIKHKEKERDEARLEAEIVRDYRKEDTGLGWDFSWEKNNK